MRDLGRVILAAGLILFATPLMAQVGSPPAGQLAAAAAAQPDLPPATKLEGFKPAAGSVVIFAYDELGRIGPGFSTPGVVSVDVRQLSDARGNGARGLFVEVIESQYRKAGSFVDADEIPELLKGLDALVEVKANPSSFKNFEVRYTTLGSLQLTAYNGAKEIQFAVRAGRTLTAARLGLSSADMLKLREMFAAASQKLSAK